MRNPIEQARIKLGLSVKELALLAGTVEVTVRTNEGGNNVRITPKILEFLADQGFDKEELQQEYEEFRQWKTEQVTKRIKATSH